MSTNSQTQTIQHKAEHRRYGFLSILALVIGSVIGSGIFFKNDSVNATTQSGFVSFLGWIVIASVVLMIATASLELFSSKKASKRAGLSGLTNAFIGPKTGKFVGMFFVYAYFPASLAAVSVYAGSLAMSAISGATGMAALGPWQELLITTLIGMGLLGMVGVINTLTEKPGKFFQSFGTGFQLLPLMIVLVMTIVLISAPAIFAEPADGVTGLPGQVGVDPGLWNPYTTYGVPAGSGVNNLFDMNSTINGGLMVDSAGNVTAYGLEEGGSKVFGALLLALPPIMFTFDGFLFASSLQNEAKSKKTYPTALITGLVVISIVYLGVAVGTIGTATPPPAIMGQDLINAVNGNGIVDIVNPDGTITQYDLFAINPNYETMDTSKIIATESYVIAEHQEWWNMGGVAALVGRLIPAASAWLPQTVAFIIVISTLTTVQGFFITGSRELANLAHADVIADTNGFYLKRNKAGVPQNSAWTLFVMSFIWLFVAKGLDAIMLADQLQGWTEFGKEAMESGVYNPTLATDFTSNFVVIVAFVMYIMPLVGGMVNRFTGKVDDVKKSKLFWVTAVPAVLIVALLTVTNILSTFAIDFGHNPLQILNVVLLLVTLAVPITFSLTSGRKAKTVTPEQWEQKEFYKAAYEALQTPEEYEATILATRAGHTTEIKLDKILKEKIKEENKDLEKKTVAELKAIAKERNLTGYSSLKKADLIKLIKK